MTRLQPPKQQEQSCVPFCVGVKAMVEAVTGSSAPVAALPISEGRSVPWHKEYRGRRLLLQMCWLPLTVRKKRSQTIWQQDSFGGCATIAIASAWFDCACGCGKLVQRSASGISKDGLNFISRAHVGEYQANQTIRLCGSFIGIVEKYLNGFATTHYRDPKKHKPRLLPFFQFLADSGFTDLEDVTPQTVTAFLQWGRSTGRKVVAYSSGTISTFFNWMLAEGRRKAPNPVVGLIHKAPIKRREPRPLETEQLTLMWRLLKERGDARVRFAAAVAEEAGLRIGEIANIRVSDVDALRQRLFVRLPNKTNKERWAYFSQETKLYFVKWMAERDPDCNHDHVLQNNLSDPMTAATLRELFKRTLCKVHNHKNRHEVGFDRWSTHRLRHTMASNLASGGADATTVMAMGGWDSHQAMANYTRVDANLARRGYDEAMRRAKEQKQTVPQRRTLTPDELLKRKGLKSTNQPQMRK